MSANYIGRFSFADGGRRLGCAASASLFLLSAGLAAAAEPAIVHLGDDNHCSIVATYKKERIGLQEVNAHRGVIIRDNIRFSTEGGSPCLTIRALVDPVRFDSDGLGGFSGDLPGSNQVSCCFCNGRGILDLAAPAKNPGSPLLRFPDGATASLSAGSTARLDFLKDSSYTFSGGGLIQVVNADGKHFSLPADAPFITGGPLHEVSDARGARRQERLSPVVPFRIGAAGPGVLNLKIGELTVQLPSAVEKNVTLPNGAAIRFSHDLLTGTFTWLVVKGHFELSIDDLPGWRATGLTENGGTLRWNPFNKMVDFQNTGAQPVNLTLPLGLIGSVDPRNSFHFEAANGTTKRPLVARSLGFMVTAATGGARVYDSIRRKNIELSPEHLLFASGDERAEAGILAAQAPDGFAPGENAALVTHGDRPALLLKAGSNPLKFSTEGVGGVTGEVPGTNQLICCFLAGSGILEFSTPADNLGSVALALPDGGSALVTPGSSARLDVFQDESYSLSARGRVEAANADGQTLLLEAHSLPLTGGPLRSTIDALGVKRSLRASPTTKLVVGKWNGDILSLTVGKMEINLPPGGEKELALPNGSALRCSQNPSSGAFSWKISKGEFMITVSGVPGWKACALSGQSGEMHWDAKNKSADLRNTSTESLVVSLPSRTAAVVDPASVFQYAANEDAAAPGGAGHVPSFTTAATGRARVDNLVAHKSYDAVPQSLLFTGGFPGKKDVSNGRIQVQSSWDNGVPLTFSLGGTNRATMQPGAKKTVTYDNNHRIEFIYSDGGALVVTAIEGNYRLILQRANGLIVDLDEGDRVTLTLDYKKGTFVLISSPDNSSIVGLQTESGAQRAVPPDHAVNFRIALDGTITVSDASTGDGVFLLDAPGAGLSGFDASSGGGQFFGNPFGVFGSGSGSTGGLTGQTDPSRISEQAASPH